MRRGECFRKDRQTSPPPHQERSLAGSFLGNYPICRYKPKQYLHLYTNRLPLLMIDPDLLLFQNHPALFKGRCPSLSPLCQRNDAYKLQPEPSNGHVPQKKKQGQYRKIGPYILRLDNFIMVRNDFPTGLRVIYTARCGGDIF